MREVTSVLTPDDIQHRVIASILMSLGDTGSRDDISLGVIARSAPPQAGHDVAIGLWNASHNGFCGRSRFALLGVQRVAVTDCHVATCGRSSQ